MIFIIGGAGSGQAEYAKAHFPEADIVPDYHMAVRRQLEAGEDPFVRAEALLAEHAGGEKELVVWSCEIGCGVVPADSADRAWREASGRVNCFFAQQADVVIRTVCGVGTVIRNQQERRNRSGQEEDAGCRMLKPAAAGGCGETKPAAADEHEETKPETAAAPRKARPIMITGTMSNAGKSFLAAGLCRLFTDDGYRVAPFKAQNMALNSFITEDGGEMGRSQVVQAQACRREPDVRMNPILLKPTTDKGSQIIILGHPAADMDAKEYYRHKTEYLPYVKEAYESLAAENDIIVLEGAGSPAEINLKDNDIVNMPMAEMADAPVLLVGNIDPGGVFAQLYGTISLLEPHEQDRIAGMIINMFRGDLSILEPGLRMIEEKTGKPVLGVIPYTDVRLEPEDSLALAVQNKNCPAGDPADLPDIAVIRLPKISNFTDLEALSLEDSVNVRYVSDAKSLGVPDAVIIPGTKSTISDLKWMRENGLDTAVRRARDKGAFIVGICGGYQMLGKKILDPHGAEMRGEMAGLGFLDMVTVFETEKIMRQTETVSAFGIPALDGRKITGYEVHMGRAAETENADAGRPEARAADGSAADAQNADSRMDAVPAAAAEAGVKNVIGTYIHGIFDEEDFREAFIDFLYERSGRAGRADKSGRKLNYAAFKEQQIAKLAELLRSNLDMQKIYRIMGFPV